MLKTAQRRVTVVAAIYLALQVACVVTGRSDDGFISDDAFYYFEIARNFVHGQGFTFDGLAPTNGFHPLFMWLCVPIYALMPDSAWLPARVALIVLVVAAAGTGWVLFRLGRAVRDDRTGELMALAYFVSPFVWILPLRGCEGALSILCLALAAWQGARLDGRVRSAVLYGALIGLAGLARTENVLFAAPAYLWLLWRTRSLRACLAAAVASAVVVSPWVIWTWSHFGTLVQVSGEVKMRVGLYGGLPRVVDVDTALRNVLAPFEHTARFVLGEEWGKRRWAPHLLVAEGALILVSVLASRRLRSPGPLVPLYLLAVLHVLFYALVLRNYYNWYFLPVAMAFAVLQGERLASAPRWLAVLVLSASLVVGVLVVRKFVARYPRKPLEAERWAHMWLDRLGHVAPGERVGVANAGRIGYFGSFVHPRIVFINMDCVVNNKLFNLWMTGGYPKYVASEIDWMVDRPGTIGDFMGPAAAQFINDHIIIYRGDWVVSRIVDDPMDPREQPVRPPGATVIEDFESDLSNWTVVGDAFAIAPGRRDNQKVVAGFIGQGIVNSYAWSDVPQGRLESKPFTIEKPKLSFLIGGGRDPEKLRVSLIVDGKRERNATPRKEELLERVEWKVGNLKGKQAIIEIVDASSQGFGHIMVDDILAH